jgi:hypothetical protein
LGGSVDRPLLYIDIHGVVLDPSFGVKDLAVSPKGAWPIKSPALAEGSPFAPTERCR